MKKGSIIILAIMAILVLTSCTLLPSIGSKEATSPTSTEIILPTPTQLPIVLPTANPLPTATQPAIATQPPQSSVPGQNLPVIDTSVYVDDRSTPAALLLSYYNAINRHEYLRAYSYWENPASSQGTLDQFSNGYKDTQSVNLIFGRYSTEGAAGTTYFTIPAIINSITTAAVQQKFAACYIIKLPNPGNYGAPPITTMEIYRGMAKVVSLSSSDADALASACSGQDFQIGPNPADPGVEDFSIISSQNYIDNRSGAVELISSFLNSINRHEVVRAYSYWQTPGDFNAFNTKYSDWNQVSATFGSFTSDAGAGQLYYQIPAVLKVQLSGGTLNTYSVCYTLHLSQPGMQGTLPFQPLQIRDEKSSLVDNNADVNNLLITACQ